MPFPTGGRASAVFAGRYPSSTSSAAYSTPRWILLRQVPSGSTVVNGSAVVGCTHHTPLFVYSTIRCPARVPLARPAMVAILSDPPTAAGGIVVPWTEPSPRAVSCRQPVTGRQLSASTSVQKGRNEYLVRVTRASTHSGRGRLHIVVMRAEAWPAYL